MTNYITLLSVISDYEGEIVDEHSITLRGMHALCDLWDFHTLKKMSFYWLSLLKEIGRWTYHQH